MSNIKINNTRKLALYIRNDEYWDMMLSKEDGSGAGDLNDDACLASFISAEEDVCTEYFKNGKVFSKVAWQDAVNSGDDELSGVTLTNIGFTGIDNGLIYYDKNMISNAEFLNYYTRSHYCTCGDTRLNLSRVRSNTGEHAYPMELVDDGEKYFAFKGGFLQGFYKTYGYDYQVLPNHIENEWAMNFVIRPRTDYETQDNILNNEHPENKGIFFYMGTRAENKFWDMSASEEEKKKYRRLYTKDGYSTILKNNGTGMTDGPYEFDTDYYIPAGEESPSIVLERCDCNNNNGISPKYISWMKCGDESNPWAEEGYIMKDISIEDKEILTNSGYNIKKDTESFYEITSDNKYLLFNQTSSGYTIEKWENEDGEGKKYVFVAQRRKNIPNYYLLFNQTPTGYTVDTIEEYLDSLEEGYDFFQDMYSNAFGLKINEDGSISYKYAIKDCGSGSTYYDYEGDTVEDKVKFLTEKTNPGLVKDNEWNNITVRFVIVGPSLGKCSNDIGKRQMKIMIYVGGYLKFISRPLPEFRFRELAEVSEKQEAVPYNISLGGGTEGLAETVGLNYMDYTTYELPIEKYFGGTFIGDIKSFRFYACPVYYPTVKLLKRIMK